ncbi:MAG: hypothetical protein CMP75_01265 [Flavobacteriales bacterium]|nr:hypothetical protein [Flavobacteriales bacterium]
MNKNIMAWGAAFALTANILRAFGAHALKELLISNQLASFETGVRYKMYHGIVLIIIGISFDKIHNTALISKLFSSGTILFSLFTYLLNMQEVIGVSLSFLGLITPIGGALLIAG